MERFRCQGHENWSWARDGIYDIEIDQSAWEDFLNEVDEGEFVFMHDTLYGLSGLLEIFLMSCMRYVEEHMGKLGTLTERNG